MDKITNVRGFVVLNDKDIYLSVCLCVLYCSTLYN